MEVFGRDGVGKSVDIDDESQHGLLIATSGLPVTTKMALIVAVRTIFM